MRGFSFPVVVFGFLHFTLKDRKAESLCFLLLLFLVVCMCDLQTCCITVLLFNL